jgi:hypothetical protein
MPRKLIAFGALLFFATASFALTPPQKISFQGKLLNPSTNNPQAGPVTLLFKIYNVPGGSPATPLYTETQSGVPLTNGVFSVQIGTNTAIFRDLFLGASAYLGVTVSGDAGGEMKPLQQLIMAPYAFTANQLSDTSDVRLIAGQTYSTFTSAGNFSVPAGVQGSSGTFSNGVTASSGTFSATGTGQYSVATSSGIDMNSGTLSLIGSAGLDAGGTGITASTATFTATGNSQYSLQTSSGINVLAGTLNVAGSGGVVAASSVKATTYYGEGSDLTTPRPKISSATLSNTLTATPAASEIVVLSTAISPSRTSSLVQIWATIGLNRAVTGASQWSLRIRRQIAGSCTTASAQVGITNTQTVPTLAGTNQLVALIKVDAPNTTSQVEYCLTATSSVNNETLDERTLILMEVSP